MTTLEEVPHPNGPTAIAPVSNAAADDVLAEAPYVARISITGTATILFHAWNNEAVAEKAAAKKGSATKKEDNVESYVYRDADGFICLPGRYLVGSLTDPRNGSAKYLQDPRSPRKSALDLFRAGVVALTELAPIYPAESELPARDWDFLDRQRVMVQRQGVTRARPAFHPGWACDLDLMVLSPEYISKSMLHEALTRAGQLVGVGDFRPTYGRFRIDSFQLRAPEEVLQ